MMRIRIATIVAAVALCVGPSAALRAQKLPSPADLIAAAVAGDKAQTERGWKYTFREDHETSQLSKDGKASPPVTKTYDHIMLEGYEYKRLVLIDGKPLDPKTQKKVDDEMEKTRLVRRKNRFLSTHRTVSLSQLDQLRVLFDNTVTGEETVLGRQAWRMESEPKANYQPANRQERELLAARYVSWFDRLDGRRIKWRALFINAAKGFQPGSSIDWEAIKVGDELLGGKVSFKMDMKFAPGIHGRALSIQTYYDYRRFTVDSKMTPE